MSENPIFVPSSEYTVVERKDVVLRLRDRRLYNREVLALIDGVEHWLSTHPDHDADAHAGNALDDPEMAACPQCHSLTLLKTIKGHLNEGRL